MKKNGFTLVELTAVLIILSVLGMIIIPIVENSINSGKNELYVAQLDSIKASLKKYAVSNINSKIKNVGDNIFLSLYQLKIENYLALDIKDPRTETLLPNDMLLRIHKESKNYTYEVLETSGTKVTEKEYNTNTPIIETEIVSYYCGSSNEELTNLINDYKVNKGNVKITYYDEYFESKVTLDDILNNKKDFRVVYTADSAYAVKNILRSGCD
ncbi:MAG: type II secretion system GspH family protein [Erysipelotrichaceae bacterium]|nr:type II secretion system GspH family protein [Erysipelotrichaceae bacterium]